MAELDKEGKMQTEIAQLPHQKIWLTPREAAEYLSLKNEKSAYTAYRSGQLPGHKIGGRLRFNRVELDEYIRRH